MINAKEIIHSWVGTAYGKSSGRPIKKNCGSCLQIPAAIYEELGLIPKHIAEIAYATSLGEKVDQLLKLCLQQKIIYRAQSPLQFLDLLVFLWQCENHHIGIYNGGINHAFWHCSQGLNFECSSLNEEHFKKGLRVAYRFNGVEKWIS